MRATALSLLLGLAFLAGPPAACAVAEEPSPAKPAEDADVAAAREAVARARAAVEEAGRAAEDARRARRLALVESLRAEEALGALLARRGLAEEAAQSEARVRDLVRQLGVAVEVPRPAAAAPPVVLPSPRRATAPTEGLQPLQRRFAANESAIQEGLDWLARHQSADGSWDSDGFAARCRESKCPGPGGPLFDVGLTGLATLPFLGAGETHKSPKHGDRVRDALKYLKGMQDAEGCFGPRTSNHFVYNHAMATLAMCEAYGLTQSPLYKASAQQGADFILQAQNPYLAWRYGVRPQDNDTSVTGWMVMALKSAKTAGLAVDEQAFRGALAWIDKVTEPEYGRVGYTARGNGPARPMETMDAFPPAMSESLTAVGILTRIHCGEEIRGSEMIKKGVDLLLRRLPEWDTSKGTIDYYYWYFGTLATFHVGGDHWKRWDEALAPALLATQRNEGDGCARGSWDPVDPWGADGGRVYSTSMATLCLEVHFRYGKALGVK